MDLCILKKGTLLYLPNCNVFSVFNCAVYVWQKFTNSVAAETNKWAKESEVNHKPNITIIILQSHAVLL